MTDITKLAKRLRRLSADSHIDATIVGSAPSLMYGCGHRNAFRTAASMIDKALPKWTKITEDKSTWPEDDAYVLCKPDKGGYLSSFNHFSTSDVFSTRDVDDWMGDWWRPMCDLDYPPEESE